MNTKKILIILLIIFSGVLFYISADDNSSKEKVFVIRVIDGDTLEIENKQKVRLLGINTPERNEPYYEEAKDFLKQLENKTVEIESSEVDRYGRLLAHVTFQGNLINKEILANGLGSLYYYDKDKDYQALKNAEGNARSKKLGIWTPSKNANCISLIELDHYDKGDETELLVLENSCETIEVTIKDDATHIYHETLKNGQFEMITQNIWNDNGDSLYIYDNSGMILFHRYVG
jgi:micrococcal nuclease